MIWELIFIAACSLLPFIWLSPDEVILGNDSGARIDGVQHLLNLWHSWNPTLSFGYDWSIMKGHMLTKLPEVLFQTATSSLHTGQQIMMVFWFFVLGVSMHTAIRMIYPKPSMWFVRLWCATYWMYNFFVLYVWANIDRAKFSLLAAIPIIFALLIRVSNRRISPIRAASISALLIFFFNAGGSAPLFGALVLIIGITALVLWNKTIAMFVFYSILLSALTSAWWLIPLAYTTLSTYKDALTTYGGTTGILEWEAMVSGGVSYTSLLTLRGLEHWQIPTNFFDSVIGFVPLALLGLLVLTWLSIPKEYAKRTILLPLFILVPVGLLFAAGTNPPLGFVYRFLITHVPGFAIFRSSFFKFAPVLWFPMIVLSGISLQILISRIRNKYIMHVMPLLCIVGILVYHSAFAVPDFFALSPPFSTKVTVPEYVPGMLDVFGRIDPNSRILLLPPLDTQFLTNSYQWGFWSTAQLPSFGPPVRIVSNEKNSPAIVSLIYRAFELGDVKRIETITRIAGITHVLWQDDVVYTDGRRASHELSPYKDTLDRMPSLRPHRTIGAWRLYEFASKTPLITAFTSETVLTSHTPNLTDATKNVMVERDTPVLNDQDIVEAICIGCTKNEISFALPSLRLYPDSPLYVFVKMRENRNATAIRANRPAMIDLHIGLTGKRIAELIRLTNRQHNEDAAIVDTINSLRDNLEAIGTMTRELTGYAKLSYADRAIDFLRFYKREFEKLALPDSLRSETIQQFDITLRTLSYLQFTSDEASYRYFVELPVSSVYRIEKTGIETAEETFFPAGFHTVEIPKRDAENQDAPRVFFVRQHQDRTAPSPSVSFIRASATRVTGSIERSEHPFLLVFGDTYSKEWKIKVSPQVQATHIRTNGYSNGWVFPPGPKRSFEISYHPQRLTELGAIISVLAVISAVWYLRRTKP